MKPKESEDERLFKYSYSIHPKFFDKLSRVFRRLKLCFYEQDVMDGESFGLVVGSRENLLKFCKPFRMTRADIASEVTPVNPGDYRETELTLPYEE